MRNQLFITTASLLAGVHAFHMPITRASITAPALRGAKPVMSAAGPASVLDADLGVGYQGAGEDWSYAKSSERNDRPLTNEQLRVFTAKSDAAGESRSLNTRHS